MLHLRAVLLQIAVAGALSAAVAGAWVWHALRLPEGGNWFDVMGRQGWTELALVLPSGAAIGLAVWLCGAGARSGWLLAILAVAGMLLLHFLVMSTVPRGHPAVAGMAAALRAWPWLAVAAFLPLAAALAGYWMSRTALAVSLQIVIAGAMSVYLALMSGMGLAEGSSRRLDWTLAILGGGAVGLAVWLLGWLASPTATNPGRGSAQLLTAVALSVLGFAATQLFILGTLRGEGAGMATQVFWAVLVAPLAAAMAGYWCWRLR